MRKPTQQRVRVWFGRHVVSSYSVEPARAQACAEATARRYAGLRVTLDGRSYRPGAQR